MSKAVVIIPAGGLGKRFGGAIPKQFTEIDGIPLIIWTIRAFDNISAINDIIIAVNEEWYSYLEQLVLKYNCSKVKELVVGGKERQDSVYAALQLPILNDDDVVLIHDAVRPFVSEALIERLLSAVETSQAVIPVINLTDTIKEINAAHYVVRTLNRDKLVGVQTPETFVVSLARKIYEKAMLAEYYGTDTAGLAEFCGEKVLTIKGEKKNIKITTIEDLQDK